MAEMKDKNNLPYAGGKVTLAMAILGMAAGITITASAAGPELNKGNNSGKTTVRLGVTTEAPKNVSYEVPLYYTAAIVKTDPAKNQGRSNQVLYPSGYHITNKSLEKDPGKDNPKELVVARVEVASVPGATWELVDQLTGNETSTDKKMAVRIGELPLPAIKAKDTTPKTAKLRERNSAFYQITDAATGAGKYLVLGDKDGDGFHDADGAGRTDLDVEFDIPPSYEVVGDIGTVAQFQVIYTLTTPNTDGTLNGLYDKAWVDADYLGPDKETAAPTP